MRKGCIIPLALLAALPVLLVVWWNHTYPSFTHRYRLTLEVEAEGEIRTGSGVVEVTWLEQPSVFGSIAERIRGQAVAVELGRHGLLLATTNGGWEFGGCPAQFIALRAFAGTTPALPPDPLPPRTSPPRTSDCGYPLRREILTALGQLVGRRVALSPDIMPALVWLPDPADRTTARPVRPAALSDDIALDVRLRTTTIEITRDPVTTGLFARLPWLAERFTNRTQKAYFDTGYPGVFALFDGALNIGIDP